MDPHILADPDPDPGSQNLADPMDPDPKHWWGSFPISNRGKGRGVSEKASRYSIEGEMGV